MMANPEESNARGHSDRIEIGGKANKSVIVPVEDFLEVVSKKTGWTPQALLYEKDIGQVEARLKIKAKRPMPLKFIKRGKSRNSLYDFVSPEARKWNHDLITTLIEK